MFEEEANNAHQQQQPNQKFSLFKNNKFFQTIANLFKPRKKKNRFNYFDLTSRFRSFLGTLDKKSPEYETAFNTVVLCEEAIKVTKQRLQYADKIKTLDKKIAEVECFDKLSDEETSRLQNMLNHFMSLSQERTVLMHQITGFDRSLTHMLKLEDEAEFSVNYVNNAEEHRRILKRDLGYLGGEKAELEYEREFIEKGQRFIRKFSIFMVSLFAAGVIILSFLFLFNDVPILLPMSVMTVLLTFIIFLLYLFNRRLAFEKKMNAKKQIRAVELLNKKTAVFAHYTNYLNYVYKKYQVRNSQMLRKNLKDIESYKHLASRMDKIRNIMYQTQAQIEAFLREKHINHLSSSVEHFAQTINVADKKQYFNHLTADRESLEATLARLDNRHEELWDLLIELNENDESEANIVDEVIKIYLEEVARILAVPDPEENEGEQLRANI